MGRLTLSFIAMDDVWHLNLLIVSFTMYFAYEAIYMVVPIIWIIFIFAFLVGFISGCTTINVCIFNRVCTINDSVVSYHIEYSISFNIFSRYFIDSQMKRRHIIKCLQFVLRRWAYRLAQF